MFAKPYKLKSTNTLKNSEKKHLAQRILDTFLAATEEKVKELVPVKSSTSCLKLVLHSEETVGVYVVDNHPIMIDTEAGLVPTVCALWKVPDLVPTISIHTPVLAKILGGAPLYLPGVSIPMQGIGFPMFAKGAVIAASTTDNMAAGVVGRAAMASADMLLKNAGLCLETLHVFGDQLCREQKFSKLERPRFPARPLTVHSATQLTDMLTEMTLHKPPAEEWPALGKPQGQQVAQPVEQPLADTARLLSRAPCNSATSREPRVIAEDPETVATEAEGLNDSIASDTLEEDEGQIPCDMDGLLRWSLLSLLRLRGKHLDLPLNTNLLYKMHLLPLCPPERTLDVKKSSYKKMSKFLEAMQREGLLEVKEIDKGVDAVVSINLTHPLVCAHKVPARVRETALSEPASERETDYTPPVVREVLCVTAGVAPLFADVKKGTPLSPTEVRNTLTEHVRSKNLKSAEQKGAVVLDTLLASILGKQEQECVKWDTLMSGVSNRMTLGTQLAWPDGRQHLVRSKLPPVTMQVANRAGNKKVTLVSNLEAYGFQLVPLARACQLGCGASCGVTRAPGAKADQLMLQGDQTYFVTKLLVEKYGLPKKYVEGADKALSKKK